MKTCLSCCCLLLLCLGTTSSVEPVTAELLHFSAGRTLPEAIESDPLAAQTFKPGCRLTFLVQAPFLAEVKTETCKLQVLKSIAGKDLSKLNGKPSYEDPARAESQTFGGRYGTFTLELDPALFPEVNQLELQGTVQVLIAEGVDKLESPAFETAKKQDLKLGEFQLKVLGEKAAQALFDVKPGTGNNTDQPKVLGINVTGPKEKLAGFRVVRKDEALQLLSRAWQNNVIDYEFDLDDGNAKLPVKLELSTWKNPRLVTVPFQVGGAKK